MRLHFIESLVYNNTLKKAISLFPTVYRKNGIIRVYGHPKIKEANIKNTINCIDEGDSVLFSIILESTVYLMRCLKTDPSVGFLVLPNIYKWDRKDFI